ncbi:MAG: UbiA-like polyprenyltransferase [Candidatus Micrarchaeia archaeon]
MENIKKINSKQYQYKKANYIHYLSDMLKLNYTIFSLSFIYIGMLLAGIPTLVEFLLLNVAAVSARASGMAANRYIGYEYDKKNPKKQTWSSIKVFSKKSILIIFLFFSTLLIFSAFLLNLLAFILSPIVILLFIIEPKLKKYTEHRHIIMGMVNGLGIFAGYIAIKGMLPIFPSIILLWLGYSFMLGGSDIIYSMNYIDFDRANNLKTYPSLYGKDKADIYSYTFHIISILFFLSFAILMNSLIIILAVFISTITIFIWHLKRKINNSNIPFSYYNGIVSIIMLFSVIIAIFMK